MKAEKAALQFAVHLLRNDQKVSFSEYEEHDELPWRNLRSAGRVKGVLAAMFLHSQCGCA